MLNTKSAIIAAAAGALAVAAFAAPAFAQAQNGQRLSISQIDQRLTAQGFRVLEIEWDDGEYEVLAINAQNQCRELDVNPRSGAIRRDRADDDCFDDDHRRQRRAS